MVLMNSLALLRKTLMEGLMPEQLKEVAHALLPFDVMLGNWQPDGAAHAITQDG